MTDLGVDRRPILVGEDNPYGTDPRYALYPLPERASGGRLCYKILGMETNEYLRRFRRINLCASGKWSMREAREAAAAVKETSPASSGHVILLGAKVSKAFGLVYDPLRRHDYGMRTYLILPHPSGLNRAWNDPTLATRCRDAVMQILSETEQQR